LGTVAASLHKEKRESRRKVREEKEKRGRKNRPEHGQCSCRRRFDDMDLIVFIKVRLIDVNTVVL
jgi:hypothetical protein